MANNVKFSTGLEEDLLKLNSDKTYVNKIDEGHVYFATKTNDDGKILGSIFYDINGQRISMGGAGIGGGLDEMGESVADKYVARISSEGAKYASTDGVTLTTYNGKNSVLNTILLPVAGADRAGVVITGAQTFAGDKTFTGDIKFEDVTDTKAKGLHWTLGGNDYAHIRGGATAANKGYLEIATANDGNEQIYIRQYSDGFSTIKRTLTLLDASGNTTVPGNITPTANNSKNLGSESKTWKNAYISNLVADTLSGHLTGSLTGNVTGNVTGHASLDLPLAGGIMTGDIEFEEISGTTFPSKSKGLVWKSNNGDNASIYFQLDDADSGNLYFDYNEALKFANAGTVHTIFTKDGIFYPRVSNTGSIGTSDNKFASIYATNFYGIIDKAYADESGNNIRATYAASLKNHAHDGSGWSFRLLNKNGGALSDALTIPGATASKAGLVTTGEQKFAGKKTFSGQVIISGGSDASKATANSGQLIVGNPAAGHLAIDGNEIMAKASGSTTSALLFQLDGGDTKFGGNVNPYATNVHSLGTQDLAWKEAHIGEIYGHLNGAVTGTLSGNASSASKWLTARKVTMTGDVTGNFTLDGTQNVSYAASIANYSLKPVKLAVHDYANYSQLNRHTAASWGFSVDTTDANGVIYTMSTLARDKFISEEFPCSGGEKFIITYEISTSCKGNSTSGGTDSTFRGTAIGLYGYQRANKANSAGFAYSDRVTGTANAPWTKVSSVVTVPTSARFFYVFVQTESYGNFSGSIKIRNLEVRRASGLDNAGDEILTKYLTRVAFAQKNVSSSDTTKKLNLQVYNGNNALKATVQVPNASTTEAGVINTGTQSFAGNKTFTGRIHFSNTTDAAKGSDSGVITIGDKSGEHMLLDGNEIMAKNGASGTNTLHIQAEGGQTEIGGNFIPKSQFNLGGSSNYWGNAYIKNLVADTLSGHLTGSLTGNVTGNASSATKLQTARKIILGNDLQGEVSFDGTKDVTFTASSYYSTIGGGNTQNYPWRRIATTGSVTGKYVDKDIVIAIRHTYNGGGYGIAKVSLRINQGPTGAVAQCELRWLIRQNIAVDALQAGFRNTAKDAYVDLFYKVGTWPRVKVYQLQGDRTWTLISSNEANDTTTSDKKTSSEAYATIAAAATALNRTYTSTVIAVDQGYVERAYKDESGNNIKASYLAAIQQVTSDKDTFTFRGFNKNNGAMNNLITIPAADASNSSNANWKAGLVTSQAQTWAGHKTFKNDITIQHLTADTMTNTSANPFLKFLNSDGSQGAMIMFTDYDTYRKPGGLKVLGLGSATPAWFEVEGALIVGGATTLNGNLTLKGNLLPHADNTYTLGSNNYKWSEMHANTGYINETLYINRGSDGTKGGIGLYGTTAPDVTGIAYRNNLGTHGYVTHTWNTYFSVPDTNTKGWIFRCGSTPVASISGAGKMVIDHSVKTPSTGTDAYIAYPGGGAYANITAIKTGYLKITLPQSWTSTMMRFKVSIYDYREGTSVEYLIGGYNYSDGSIWKHVYAQCLGDWEVGTLSNLKVRFGHDGTKCAIYIGESATTWKCPQVTVSNVTVGYRNYTHDKWSSGWNVDFTTTLGTISETVENTHIAYRSYHADRASADESGANIKANYLAKIRQVESTGTTFKFTGVNKNNGDMADLISIPKATTTVAGLVTNDAQTWAGNKTFTNSVTVNGLITSKGNIHITNSNPNIKFTDTGKNNQVHYVQGYNGNLYFGPGRANSPYVDSTGVLHTIANKYTDNYTVVGLNLHNSDIVGVNSIYTADASGNSQKGIHFYRDDTHVDTIWVANGVMYFTPNRTIGGAGTSYYIARTATKNGNVGSTNTLTYVEDGVIKASTATVGGDTQPVYLSAGTVTPISYTAIAYGGTGATTRGQAINNLLYVGNNPITSTTNDTTANWAQYSNTVSFFTTAGCLVSQPNRRGLVLTIGAGNNTQELHQIWSSQPHGDLWHRGGNESSWGGTWRKILDTSNYTSTMDGRYVKKSGDTMTGMLRVNDAPIFGNRYRQNINAPAFVFDKPGSNYTGIGANGTSDTIYFSAVTDDGNWNWTNDYKQKWQFNGSIIADSASISGLTTNSLTIPGGYVKKREDGTSYNCLGTYYARGSTAAYVRIALPAFSGWNMCQLELSIRESYSSGRAGKLIIYAYCHPGQNWTQFYAVYHDRLSSAIKVYGSDNRYFYIGGIAAWGGLTVDKMVLGDAVTGADMSNVVIDGVSALPGTYQTATMLRSWVQGDSVTNAVWNDYAECREADSEEPGYVLVEKGDDTLTKATERLQSFAGIVSDTWGFSQGETDKAKTNIAVAGRVLAYTYQPRERYKPGDCVCAAPGGLVDIMTREEVIKYPDRIIGTVSHVPDYEIWGGGDKTDRDPVKVNGRIWIKIK